MSAIATELAPEDSAEGLEAFSRRGVGHGGSEWTLDDVQAPAKHRLYRASAVDQFVLDERDTRLPVNL